MMEYDVIVVGGGHAGCEAAMAAANLGSRTLLISMDMTKFGAMSCNPAIGGIAKGQIVREVDALGGYMGLVTDASSLQFRMLNKSKGPAMWSPRAQCDKILYTQIWREILLNHSKLNIYQDSVEKFVFENGKIAGVQTVTGAIFKSQAVILTAGTFLSGKMFIGQTSFIGGRIGEPSSEGLTEQLIRMGVKTARMKTGTPPRIDINSVNVDALAKQWGDDEPERFSFLNIPSAIQKSGEQMPCYIVHTNTKVHDILRTGFDRSPLFTGLIKGIGPRYCPSIEDKLRTFSDKDSHPLFLEPEGRNNTEYYLQGFSSSLPLEVQVEAMHHIEGLENARIFRPAYAVEYDFFDPTQLKANLELKDIPGLFFAGQINGTTGYEEAAGQGIMAGINAHLHVQGKEPFILSRDESYIGVLIDDLITKGVDEPYRMFTSRAEYRILLRGDNADFRLTPKSYELGLATKERYDICMRKYEKVEDVVKTFESTYIKPEKINPVLQERGGALLEGRKKASDLLIRPEVSIGDLLPFVPCGTEEKEVLQSAEIAIKYAGYIDRERRIADKIHKLEDLKIPDNFDFSKVESLSIECRLKLAKYKPTTIAQASRISGVSPADISVLLVYFGR
ncbi:MAG: tRNA uridine-5-carboxymethylaminomethyl(34) synthesis enzyme MnmG [Bacteroidales bacterium]|nr:tRNA uridine-5-carboxymethylaminomethyl(34) synthesis enzyme MnmG [Bacteroidales bacterium]